MMKKRIMAVIMFMALTITLAGTSKTSSAAAPFTNLAHTQLLYGDDDYKKPDADYCQKRLGQITYSEILCEKVILPYVTFLLS